jgi:hypothetical protein
VTALTRSASSLGVVGWTVFASGLLAAIGVAFLAAMFVAFAAGATSAGQLFGRVNDVLIMVSYPLAIPAVLALRALVRPHAPVIGDLAALVGVGAIGAIGVLQACLVFGLLTFEQQIGPVSIALLLFGVSLVVTGYVGRSSGVLPHGLRMGLIGATYVGYPFWARWAGRRLARPDLET